MPIINGVANLRENMEEWRHAIHAHPETAFEEERTADYVAARLEEFGLEVKRGLAKTGVVARLVNGSGPAIGLRADLDALPMDEQTNLSYRSQNSGKMHACGHDGHTAMLLGAARYLSENRNFSGSVTFIFQPAEEMAGGGKVMVEEGLFEQFPVDSVYGMHNWPDMPAGQFGIRPGPAMASAALFEIKVTGKGSHAAFPHQGIDPIVVGSAIVQSLQSIASRNTDPVEGIVISVTQFHAGDADNVIADEAILSGTARSFLRDAETVIEPAMRRIVEGVAEAHGATAVLNYRQIYPVLINAQAESEIAAKVAADVVGEDKVSLTPPPSMGAEDFSFMLNERPGSFVWLGSGFDDRKTHPLHSTQYEFNDDVLTVGASYWVKLVEKVLGGG